MRRPQITTYVIARNVPTQKPHKTCRTRECRCANPARRSGGRAGFAHGAHASSGTQAICRPLQTFLIAPWRLSVRNGTSSSLERLLKNTPAWGDGPASLADFLGNHCRPRALRRRIPDFFNSLLTLDRKCRQVSVSDHRPDAVLLRVSHFVFVSDFEFRASGFTHASRVLSPPRSPVWRWLPRTTPT